jgi:hypothetical protein
LNLRSHAPEACALAGLSYILELAPMTRIELAFPDRQSGPFARWGHGQLVGQLVRSAGIEPAWSPTALSRRRVYQFRHEREFDLEDLVGLEPTVTCVDGLRIRSLGRWGHRSVMEDPGGFEPLAHGLKVRSISIQV